MAHRAREVNMQQALELIESGSQKDRANALDDLIALFSKSSRTQNLASLDDKAYHRILDTIFRCAVSEKQAYYGGGSKRSSKSLTSSRVSSAAASRLGKCAEALRVVLENCTGKLKRKTLVAVIDHVTQTLPGPSEDDLTEPLLQDYIKAFIALLGNPASVELLATFEGVGWFTSVDFVVQLMTHFDISDKDSSGPSRASPAPGTLHNTPILSNAGRSVTSAGSQQRGNSRIQRGLVQDLLDCLLCLVSAPNAPLVKRSRDVSTVAIQVLQNRTLGMTPALRLACAVINKLLPSVQADNMELACEISGQLVRLIGQLWQTRSASKDDALLNSIQAEMLGILINAYITIENLVCRSNSTVIDDLKDLCDMLWLEYARRDTRAQLQQDDLSYSKLPQHRHSFKTNIFSLRSHHLGAERRWALVHVLALLEGIIWRRSQKQRPVADEDDERQPRKKRRKAHGVCRVSHNLASTDTAVQFGALQTLPFFLAESQMDTADFQDILSLLVNLTGHKSPQMSTWAMIASASVACCAPAAESCYLSQWRQLWHFAARALSIPGSCRAACVLLEAVIANNRLPYHEISDDVKTIVTAADVSGPATAVDSAVTLMTRLLKLRNFHVPSASYTTSSHVVRWLFLRWDPADHAFILLNSTHVAPLDIVNLLRATYGMSDFVHSSMPQVVLGPIGEIWSRLQERSGFLRYLLLLDDPWKPLQPLPVHRQNSSQDSVLLMTGTSDAQAVKKLIAELLYPKLQEALMMSNAWSQRDGTAQISPERLHSLFCCLLVAIFIMPQMSEINPRQTQDLPVTTSNLLKGISQTVSESLESQILSDVLLKGARPCLPRFSVADLTQFSRDFPNAIEFFGELSASFDHKSPSQSMEEIHDSMDLDDDFATQDTRSSDVNKTVDFSRRTSPALDVNSFRHDTVHRLRFMQILHQDPAQVGLVPTDFLDAFLAIPDEEFLSCEHLISELFSGDLVINPTDAMRVIEHSGRIIGRAIFISCEVALQICLLIMTGFMGIWTDRQSELFTPVGDMYEHFLQKGIRNNLLSHKIQATLANMLLFLTMVDENYPESLDMPITIQSIFEILKQGVNLVKFSVGAGISQIFSRYVLTRHDEVCTNLLDFLPGSEDDVGGIAIRLFFLSEMAQSWPTLLRRCVYHIFETPGVISGATDHASFCIRKIAASLKLADPKELFDLFSSQILFTWLSDDPVETIPYKIFGFANLQEMLERGQAEAAALVLMRGQDSNLNEITALLKSDEQGLIQSSFSKVLAYCIAHDISMTKSDQPSGETRIRRYMGKEPFVRHVYLGFADIVAQFLAAVDQEDPIEKSWAKDPSLCQAAETMKEIRGFGHSGVELIANQQPSFRGRYLVDQMKLLCRRTEYEFETVWSSALVVAVARRLFNMIHPALGSLHACSVLRKVRILLCLAGPLAWQSYPLEQLLHSIRPWLVNAECADDALGMTEYLLTRGSGALSQSPSFLAGYALSTLASLRVFLESSQASTTQESQFKETMNKAQRFHVWFSRYLTAYESPRLQAKQQIEAFKAITIAATNVRSSGNSDKRSHESTLLLEILRDETGGCQLLNEPSRNLALDILCRDFLVSPSFVEDSVGSDSQALEIASPVWKSAHVQSDKQQYLVWAGRVIGRAFAASGEIDRGLLRESTLHEHQWAKPTEFSSEQGLLKLLQTLTTDINCQTAGLAESALRNIVSKAVRDENNTLLAACRNVLSEQLEESSNWERYHTPPSDLNPNVSISDKTVFLPDSFLDPQWSQKLTISLIQTHADSENTILGSLIRLLQQVKGFAKAAFPFIVHLVLLYECGKQQHAKRSFSLAIKEWLKLTVPTTKENSAILINTFLYLRAQRLPGESSVADRAHWLDVDLSAIASAAARIRMHKTALLFVESGITNEGSRTSRRSSAVRAQDSEDVLMDIFEHIDDPDAYYGLSTNSSLRNVLARLEYEKDGNKSLAFRGAQYDSHVRTNHVDTSHDQKSLVETLSGLGLAGLSNSFLRAFQGDGTPVSVDDTFSNARKLEIWNLPAPPATDNPSVNLYRAYQACHRATDSDFARKAVQRELSHTAKSLFHDADSTVSIRHKLGALAALTELDDILGVPDPADLDTILTTFDNRSQWMKSGRYADVRHILSCRETTFRLLGKNPHVRRKYENDASRTRIIEIKSILLSSSIYRFHQANQESLNIATTLNDMIVPSQELGLFIDASAKLEAANSLWGHGEMTSSIRMLLSIDRECDLKKQSVPVRRSDLLAKIGHQVSFARLEKADSIQKDYLQPALKELKGKTDGQDAGKVYHQFAVFCDEQLQNPDSLEDLGRLQHLKKGKSDEVAKLKEMISGARDSQTKGRYQSHLAKAKQWLDLDEQELRRVEQTRREFVRLSLENYLLSLAASDEHNNDSLRFTALWLERAEEEFANEAVKPHISQVPTRKFAPLMNQLSSRLLDQDALFQKLLIKLVFRICVDHPYHGMYQIWAGKLSHNNKDETAVSRNRATIAVSRKLEKTSETSAIWLAIDKTSRAYHILACEKDSGRYKQGQKMAIKDSKAGYNLMASLTKYSIPPPTLQIELQTNNDYAQIPHIVRLEPEMTIASGVSAPKIVTLVGTDGRKYKQLIKGGTDDLRQDAIMEQVFSAVSSVLKLHRTTQQRNLDIRTYKVLPLTSTSGLIEFVPNTIPLHEYLMPAHDRFHPKDLKGSVCRREISGAQNKSTETRVSVYKKVTERFQPVMRYFFMEHFLDPDEWFAKRTAYTRTTAAISILGHVLGLGDRHGHNILLDSVTGEVVHIDLGVAFEMGRVLPVPELVPFRLTRDIVDGMGITKAEGVFRRCCEFTLDALREETYSIMTILDVLRYDPLYSWSISPVRMAKLQDTRRDEDEGLETSEADTKKKKGMSAGAANEPSEADRALEVVRKKLSKTLSVTATVNDLINQATDPSNLAVLYSGWAAYA